MESAQILVEQGLLYVVAPVWLLAGLADAVCHRVMRIEHSAGVRESLLHLLMLAQLSVAALSPLLLQPTAAVFALMLIACLAHEATTCADLAWAASHRPVPWFEQWVHGVQQAMPWAWLTGWMIVYAPQALALLGLGGESRDWGLRPRQEPLPAGYVAAFLASSLLLVVLPFAYEWWRCWRARTHVGNSSGSDSSARGN